MCQSKKFTDKFSEHNRITAIAVVFVAATNIPKIYTWQNLGTDSLLIYFIASNYASRAHSKTAYLYWISVVWKIVAAAHPKMVKYARPESGDSVVSVVVEIFYFSVVLKLLQKWRTNDTMLCLNL